MLSSEPLIFKLCLEDSPRHNHSANATISASFFGNLGIVRGQKTEVRDQKSEENMPYPEGHKNLLHHEGHEE